MEKKGKRSMLRLMILPQMARERDATDVQGSWTGTPWDEGEEPVQDVDDL